MSIVLQGGVHGLRDDPAQGWTGHGHYHAEGPQRLSVLNRQMFHELEEASHEVGADPAARVIGSRQSLGVPGWMSRISEGTSEGQPSVIANALP